MQVGPAEGGEGPAWMAQVWGGGVNCYFLPKIGFYLIFLLDHFRDLHLIPKPSPGSQFPSGHAGIGVIQRCEAEMEAVRDGFKKKKKRRARRWQKMQTMRYGAGGREMEGGQGGSTQIPAFFHRAVANVSTRSLMIGFTHAGKQSARLSHSTELFTLNCPNAA